MSSAASEQVLSELGKLLLGEAINRVCLLIHCWLLSLVRRCRLEEAALVAAVQVGSDLPVRVFMIAALQKVGFELSSLGLLRRGCRRQVGEI